MLRVYPTKLSAVYREYAAKSMDLALRFSDTENKRVLLVMARAWLAMAARAEKNSQTVTAYETLEPDQRLPQQRQSQADDPTEIS
jgi:hypothetical protein